MLVVQLISALTSLMLRTLAVDVIRALGLGQLVNLAARNAGQQLLGELVGDGLACRTNDVSLLTSVTLLDSLGVETYPPCAGGPQKP